MSETKIGITMSDCNLHENQRKAGTLCRSMNCTKMPTI